MNKLTYSPPEEDRKWGIWTYSYYSIPKDIFHLLPGEQGKETARQLKHAQKNYATSEPQTKCSQSHSVQGKKTKPEKKQLLGLTETIMCIELQAFEASASAMLVRIRLAKLLQVSGLGF